MTSRKSCGEGYGESGCTWTLRLSTTFSYASTMSSSFSGATAFRSQVDVTATTPSVRNWLAYVRYRQKDSASSGSLVMSVKMNTRGVHGNGMREAAPRVEETMVIVSERVFRVLVCCCWTWT